MTCVGHSTSSPETVASALSYSRGHTCLFLFDYKSRQNAFDPALILVKLIPALTLARCSFIVNHHFTASPFFRSRVVLCAHLRNQHNDSIIIEFSGVSCLLQRTHCSIRVQKGAIKTARHVLLRCDMRGDLHILRDAELCFCPNARLFVKFKTGSMY